VEIANCRAEAPCAIRKAGFCRYIGERSVVIVPEQFAGMAFLRAQVRQGGSVDEINVHPAIVVEVENGNTAANRFKDVKLLRTAAGEMEIKSCSACHVGKLVCINRRASSRTVDARCSFLTIGGNQKREQRNYQSQPKQICPHRSRLVAIPVCAG